MPNQLLTLLTDFGLSDSFVGVMKGVIAGIAPTVQVIDLTHQIPAQNIALGRFALMTAVPYFPVGTVHVAVVDPSVGGDRRSVAIVIGHDSSHPLGFLVGPDNGLFSGVLSQYPALAAVELTNPQYWRIPEPSSTFHGRDIFAPVGAHLAQGVPLDQLGTAIAPDTLVQLNLPPCHSQGNMITGCIQAMDHFGNLITNIPGNLLPSPRWSVRIGTLTVAGDRTYSNVPPGQLIALIGSHGYIEIAINHGNAEATLNLHLGNPIEVFWAISNGVFEVEPTKN
jgi:S-adenosylmethionine hydrolase